MMSSANTSRIKIKLLKELCAEQGIDIELFSHDWVIRLSKNGVTRHIMGYDWELNSATAHLLAKDKSACFDLLAAKGIAAVEHKLFLGPEYHHYIAASGNWPAMIDYAEQHGYALVCKPNEGTGGNDLFKISNAAELELAMQNLFSRHRSVAVCPFYDIDIEYRVIVLNGAVQLIYAKHKPHVVGDGQRSIFELMKDTGQAALLEKQGFCDINLSAILPEGETVELGWKHNLAHGAKPSLVDDRVLAGRLTDIAVQAMQAINIHFASVDIASCNGEWMVMEINSGIMTEGFARENAVHYALAREVYKNALAALFAGA